MSKNQCRASLKAAANSLQELIEMLDEDDGLNAFVELYEELSMQINHALALAVRSAIPED